MSCGKNFLIFEARTIISLADKPQRFYNQANFHTTNQGVTQLKCYSINLIKISKNRSKH